MDLAGVQFLCAYNRWANTRVLEVAGGLSVEAFIRNLGSSFPSVRDTLVHILWAEWIWLQRWTGTSPREIFDPAGFASVAVVRTRWAEVEAARTRLVEQLMSADLDQFVAYTNVQGETWRYALRSMLQHAVNHSTYHRGQLATMFRQLGVAPPATDLLVFIDEGAPDGAGARTPMPPS